jgi:hypothetical protein
LPSSLFPLDESKNLLLFGLAKLLDRANGAGVKVQTDQVRAGGIKTGTLNCTP